MQTIISPQRYNSKTHYFDFHYISLIGHFIIHAYGQKKMKILHFLPISMQKKDASSKFKFYHATANFHNSTSSGSAFTNHSQEHSLSSSPRFPNLNVTQLLIG